MSVKRTSLPQMFTKQDQHSAGQSASETPNIKKLTMRINESRTLTDPK